MSALALLPGPGQSPQGPAPLDQPHPALANLGFHGPVSEFNQRLQAVHDAYQQVHGQPPPPGIALNVTTSKVRQEDISKLFQPSFLNPDLARLQGTVVKHQQMNPDDHFVVRPDGVAQPDNPVRRIIYSTTPVPPKEYVQLQKQYPMVMEGGLPIPNLDEFYSAMKFLNSPIPMAQKNPNLAIVSPLSQYTGVTTPDEQQARRAVFTIKQAQTELNKEMGTHLPVTGIMNGTWQTTLQNWTKTKDYFHKQALFQSKQDGFGQNLAAYKKAWLSKQKQMQSGFFGHFMAAMPLQLFGHGGFLAGLESLPGYLAGGSYNPINIGLHGIMRSAGLALDVVGGTITQAKADIAAGTTFAEYMRTHTVGSHTYEEALQKARQQLHANPSWMRAFGFGSIPVNEPRWLRAIDGVTNVAGDLILLRKSSFTGESVAPDLEAALKSEHLSAASGWSYNDLAKYGLWGIGRASARLERGDGALQLVTRAAKLIKDGKMTPEEYKTKVAELYATWKTEIGGKEIEGSILRSLRGKGLPTPGLPGKSWLQSKGHLRTWLDQFDSGQGPFGRLATDRSITLVNNLRTAVSHYVPRRSGYFDPNLPEQVFNFTLRHMQDSSLANKLESQIVRFQATNNVQGIRRVEQLVQRSYYSKNIGKAMPPDEPFKAVLSSEGPSIFHFPGGGEEEVTNATTGLARWTKQGNRFLNRVASIHARLILAGANPFSLVGGFSLFWKHAIGDTLRAEMGGGGIFASLSSEVRAAKKEINGLANSDNEISRRLGQFRERIVKGETRWALNRGGASVFTRTFKTGENFGKRNYMEAAGGYLRRRLDDPAFDSYQSGGTWPASDDPLVQLVLHDKNYQGLWRKARRQNPDMTAEDYAALIHDEYQPMEAALQAKELTLQDAKNYYNSVRGADDAVKLGQWLQKHGVDMEVKGGLVHDIGTFDEITGRWIANVIMAPNKWNRGRFGENILAKTYAEMRAAGMEQKAAFNVGTDLAYAMTKYHMLDFANRLQVEQDLRWMSYFATKTRLYWKWVLGTFVRHPGYAAAVEDFRQALNSHGGITIPVKVMGSEWQIPAERLVWVPGKEYDETSPLGSTVLNFVKAGGSLLDAVRGTTAKQSNIITRSDTATIIGTKLLKLYTGAYESSYGFATQGLDKSTADKINQAINQYQMDHLREHGQYAPVDQVVKLVLIHQMAQEYWRANLPLPLIPYQTTTEEDKLLAQFESILNPKARRDFLAKHKGFSDSFGIYQDPTIYLHNQPYFQKWTNALDGYTSARNHLFSEAQKTGQWTPALEEQRRMLSAALQKTHDQLLIADAKASGIDTHGQVPNGDTIPYGKWGKVVNKNPIFDLSHYLSTIFPNLSKAQDGNVIGPLQQQAQQDLNQLNDPKSALSQAMTPQELKTTKVELLQKLDVFRNYPTDALGQVQQQYQNKYVNTYWKQSDTQYNQIGALPSAEKSAATATYRAWRDSQDHPVVVNGITFPSPVRMAWALLDPKTREQRLAVLGSKPPQDLANYELDLLGIKHPPNVSEAFSAIAQAKEAYYKAYPGHGISKAQLIQVAKQIDKQPGYQGFYSYYINVVSQPRIRQYEQTSLYRDMPTQIRSEFDAYIGSAAKAVAQGIAANGHSSYYKQEWRQAVKNQIIPWLNDPEQGPLRRFLAPYGPNFLNDLVSTSAP